MQGLTDAHPMFRFGTGLVLVIDENTHVMSKYIQKDCSSRYLYIFFVQILFYAKEKKLLLSEKNPKYDLISHYTYTNILNGAYFINYLKDTTYGSSLLL